MPVAVVESEIGGRYSPNASDYPHGKWTAWPIYWNGIIVGVLSALALAAVFGLIAVAVGAQLIGAEHRLTDLKAIRIGTAALSIFGAFLSFVAGGWVAAKIAGILHSEPAMLHGGIVWAAAMPFLMILTSIGAAGYTGGWYSGVATSAVANTLPFERPESIAPDANRAERANYLAELATYREQVQKWREETPSATRNTALCAITALLLGLVGSVVGGWMACGEPMTLTYRRESPSRIARA